MDVNGTVTSSAHHRYEDFPSAASDAARADEPASGRPPEPARAAGAAASPASLSVATPSPTTRPVGTIESASPAAPVGMWMVADPKFQWRSGYTAFFSAHTEYQQFPRKSATIGLAMQRLRHFFLRCLAAQARLPAHVLPAPVKGLDLAELQALEAKYAPRFSDYFIRREFDEHIQWVTEYASVLEDLAYLCETLLYSLRLATPASLKLAWAPASTTPATAAYKADGINAAAATTAKDAVGGQAATRYTSPNLEVAMARFDAAIEACFALHWPANLQCDMEKVLNICAFSRDVVAVNRYLYVEHRSLAWLRYFMRKTATDIAYVDAYADAAWSIAARGQRASQFINAPQHARVEVVVNNVDVRFTNVPDEAAFANAVFEYVSFVASHLATVKKLNAGRR